MPAAAKALFMNSYWNMSVMMLVAAMAVIVVVQMVGNLHVAAARHHEDVAVGADYLDVGVIKPRQHRRGDHFVHRAEHRLAVAEIEHAVERAEQLIELMRAEQHGDLALAADLAHHVDRHLLMARVEADRRLSDGRPQRSPCSELAMKSSPRTRRSGSTVRTCGR